jgi:acetyl esterase/lipase
MSSPGGAGLKAVVDFFGPTLSPRLHGDRSVMPPVLIHHGTDDRVVSIEDSKRMVSELRAVGKTHGLCYEFIEYPGAGSPIQRSSAR